MGSELSVCGHMEVLNVETYEIHTVVLTAFWYDMLSRAV